MVAPLRKCLLTALAAAGCLFAGLPAATTLAQSNPGLTIFSGIPREDQLTDYHLDFGGRRNFSRERYKLRFPMNRAELGVADLYITYPSYFRSNNGEFDLDDVELRLKKDRDVTFPIREVREEAVGEDYYQIYVSLEQPIRADDLDPSEKLELVFHNVHNPDSSGIFYFSLEVQSPVDVLRRYAGTWIVSID